MSTAPMNKDKYAVIKTDSTGKVSVTTLDGKEVTKNVKASSLDRAIKEKEQYMFLHPKNEIWTREIHMKSSMWLDVESYTGTGTVSAQKPQVKETKAAPKKVAPVAKTTKPAVKTAPKATTAPATPVSAQA